MKTDVKTIFYIILLCCIFGALCFFTGYLVRGSGKAELDKITELTESLESDNGKLRRVFGIFEAEINRIESGAEKIKESIGISAAGIDDSLSTLDRLDQLGRDIEKGIELSQYYYKKLTEFYNIVKSGIEEIKTE